AGPDGHDGRRRGGRTVHRPASGVRGPRLHPRDRQRAGRADTTTARDARPRRGAAGRVPLTLAWTRAYSRAHDSARPRWWIWLHASGFNPTWGNQLTAI